jgi:hypothetical protein
MRYVREPKSVTKARELDRHRVADSNRILKIRSEKRLQNYRDNTGELRQREDTIFPGSDNLESLPICAVCGGPYHGYVWWAHQWTGVPQPIEGGAF